MRPLNLSMNQLGRELDIPPLTPHRVVGCAPPNRGARFRAIALTAIKNRAREAAAEMAERVERLVGGQKELLANVSHELRSPLARLRMALALLPREGAAEAHLAEAERDLAELERLSQAVKNELAKVPGVTDPGAFNLLGQPNLVIKVDRAKAARYGITVSDMKVSTVSINAVPDEATIYIDRRLTFGDTLVAGWTPDGDLVLSVSDPAGNSKRGWLLLRVWLCLPFAQWCSRSGAHIEGAEFSLLFETGHPEGH